MQRASRRLFPHQSTRTGGIWIRFRRLDASPCNARVAVQKVLMQFVRPTKPAQASVDVYVEIRATCFLESKQRHWSHAVLVHRVHRIMFHHSAGYCVIVPPPLAEGALQAANRTGASQCIVARFSMTKDMGKVSHRKNRVNLVRKATHTSANRSRHRLP